MEIRHKSIQTYKRREKNRGVFTASELGSIENHTHSVVFSEFLMIRR